VNIFRRKPGYRWVMFGLSFSNMMAEGGITDVVPVIYLAVRNAFHWSATATSGIFSVAGLTGAITAPLAGRLLDHLDPRYVFLVGGLLIATGFVTSSFASELWHLMLLYGVVLTMGETIVSGFAIHALLVPWFPRARGRVIGLVEAGNPVGTLLLVPLAQLLVSTLGWQETFRVLGLVFLLLLGPGNFFFLRRAPAETSVVGSPGGQTTGAMAVPDQPADDPSLMAPAGDTTVAGPTAEDEETGYLPWRQILRMPAVWLLALARFLGQTGRFLVQVHLVAFLAVAGYDPLLAASAIGVMGVVNLVGRPTMGALSDALGREIVLTLGYGLHILALTVLMFLGDGDSLWPVMIFVGLSGFCDGIGGLVTSAKVADLFPARSLGTVMGIMEGCVKLAYMSGPLVGGVLFDRQGDYQAAFIMAMVLMAAAAVLFWGVPLTSRRIPK
jgi:predicted MFS family arabinose efflux permease